jgi:hypothetical protein
LAGKSEGMRQLAKPRYRWKYNITMGLEEIALAESCEQGNETWSSMKDGKFLGQLRDHQ